MGGTSDGTKKGDKDPWERRRSKDGELWGIWGKKFATYPPSSLVISSSINIPAVAHINQSPELKTIRPNTFFYKIFPGIILMSLIKLHRPIRNKSFFS